MPLYPDLYDESTGSVYPDIYTNQYDRSGELRMPFDVIAQRAAKANYVLKDFSPGFDKIVEQLNKGGEGDLRQQIASQEDLKHENARLSLLKEIGASPDITAKFDAPTMQFLMTNAGKSQQDPAYSLESAFANNWINDFILNTPNKETMRQAMDKSYKDFMSLHESAKDILARQQAFLKLKQDLDAQYEQMPFAATPNKDSKLYAFARNFSDLVNWYDVHDVVSGAPRRAYTPGGQEEEKLRYMWLAPIESLPKNLNEIRDLARTNINAARELATKLLQYGTSDAFVKNALLGVNIATGVTATSAVKVLGRTGERLTEALAKETGKTAATIATEASTKPVQRSAESGGIKLLTDQRPKPAGLLEDLRPGSDQFKQGELFPTDSSIYTRQGELKLEPPPFASEQIIGFPLEREYTPIRDPKTGNVRFETYGEGADKYQLGHKIVPKAYPRGEDGRFVAVPKEQLNLDITTPQKQTQFEAPLVGGKGVKPTPTVAADKVSKTETFTKEDYLKAAADFSRGPRELNVARNAYVDAIQAGSAAKLDPQRAFTRIGDLENAAVAGAAKEIAEKLGQVDPEGLLQPLTVNAPHSFNPNIYAKPADSSSGVAASRLAEAGTSRTVKFLDILSRSTRVTRQTEEELRRSIDATKEFDMQGFKNFNHALYNAFVSFDVTTPSENRLTNTGLMHYWFGTPQATLFDSKEAAVTTAIKGYHLPEGGFKIRNDGGGWGIVITKPVRETGLKAFDTTIETTASKIPNNWFDYLLRKIKTSDAVTSLHDTVARKVATSAPAELRAFENEAINEIKILNKSEKAELQKVLEWDNTFKDPTTNKVGTYQYTQDQFEKVFYDLNHKIPSGQQIAAYHALVQLNDYDYMKRGLEWLSLMHRQGGELVRFNFSTPGKENKSEWLIGRRVEDINWAERGDAVIYYHDSSAGTGYTFHKIDKSDDTVRAAQELRKKIKDGELQVVEIGNPKSSPLKGNLDIKAPINYVLTQAAEFKPLSVTDIAEYRPGGHIVYGNRYYLKQPNIQVGYKGLSYFYGDKTIMGFDTEKEAVAMSKIWNEAARLMKAGDDTALSSYLSRNIPDMSIEKFKKFYTEAGPGGGLSADIPVKHTETNRSVFETHPDLKDMFPGVKEQLTTPDMMQTLDKQFIADRGQILNTAKDIGTESNPMFRIDSPNLINPYVAMTRAMNSSTRGRWLNDYKLLAAEHWIDQFSGTFENLTKQELMNNPVYYLSRADRLYNKAVDRKTLALAEESRQRILNFIGHGDDVQRDVAFINNKILDSLGNYGVGKEWQTYLRDHMLDKMQDPASHIRAFAFHPNIGLYNVSSFFTQLATIPNIMSVAPKHAFQSMAAATLQRGMLHTEDPKIWAEYAKIAGRLGMDEDHFLEAFQSMRRTGWYKVGGEVAAKDAIPGYSVYKSAIGTFLDKGTMFFNAGEQAVRMSAWNVAYREWRTANPNKVMTALDEANILSRADDLGVNMTRASNANWNEGMKGVVTQYWAYNARLTEQIWDGIFQTGAKKLSRAEAGRLLFMNSLIYGIPSSFGVTLGLGLYNPYEDINSYARDKLGIKMNNKYFQFLTDGLSSTISSWMTGRDYDTGHRFGPGTTNPFIEAIRGDKKFGDAFVDVLGAAPKTFASYLKTAQPVLMGLVGAISGNDSYKLTTDDFLDNIKEIKSVSNVARAWDMYNTQKFFSKNRTEVVGATTVDALVMAITGTSPRGASDAMAALKDEKAIKAAKEEFTPLIIREYRRALENYAKNDKETGDKHLKNVNILTERAGLNWQERQQIMKRGLTGWENLYDRGERLMQTRKATTPGAQ